MTDFASSGQCLLLVGYDDSEAGAAALRTGADLARRLGARVRVVHAVPHLVPLPAAPTALMSDGFVLPPAEDVDARCARTREELAGRVRGPLEGLDWDLTVVAGDAVTVLEEQAELAHAYLVVVGTRHSGLGTALDRMLTGSTSRGLQRRARRPVLVVPEPH